MLGIDVIAIVSIAFCIRQYLAARRAAAQAKRAESASATLYEGARFIAGEVDFANGASRAVRVTIGQTGNDILTGKNRVHRWQEVTREIEAQPFYVQTRSGERIRVEPPKDVMLIDSLDQMEWLSSDWRQRRAELTKGEHVVIEGRLERGADPEAHELASTYRSNAPVGWVMKDAKRRGMRISTEGLSKQHQLRGRAFIRALVAVLVVELAALSVLVPYHVRLVLGRNVVGLCHGKYVEQIQRGKRGVENHYKARISYSDDSGDIYAEHVEIDSDDYDRLPSADRRIWIRYVPRKSWATSLGIGTSVNGPMSLLALAFEAAGIFFIVRTYRRKRWYEGPLVQNMPGPLPMPTRERFPVDRIETLPPAGRSAAPDVEPISANFSAGSEQERQD